MKQILGVFPFYKAEGFQQAGNSVGSHNPFESSLSFSPEAKLGWNVFEVGDNAVWGVEWANHAEKESLLGLYEIAVPELSHKLSLLMG